MSGRMSGAKSKSKPKSQSKVKSQAKVKSRTVTRPLLTKIAGSIYGMVVKVLGNCKFDVLCFDDGKRRQCILKNIIKRQKKISPVEVNDVVLVGIRDFDDNKGDIIYLYFRNFH